MEVLGIENSRIPGIWRALDDDMSGFVTLAELDEDSNDVLVKFKRWCTEYFGSVYLPGTLVDCSVSPSPANLMPSCAYQFRLRASKRTTNGYHLIYTGVEDTWHATIQRP